MASIEVRYATRRVANKIEQRGLTLDDCIDVLENNPYEIRSGTDKHGNPKYAAYGETYDGRFALVVYVVERDDLWKILSARTNLNRAETRLVRQRKKK
jgi:uncharacterized DUF497 family protein